MTSIYSSSSTNSSTNSANLLRISGMASGIDTDSVVKSMVSSYQTKIDKENQAQQLLQWKQESYRDIIKDIKGLQDYFDPISSKYILSENSFNVNSASSANSSIVSATIGSAAKAGTYTVNVTQLAEQAKNQGDSLNTIISMTDAPASDWSEAKLKIGTTDITLDSIEDNNGNGTTVDEVVANINKKISENSDLNGKISASYVKEGNSEYIKFTSTSSMDLTATKKGSAAGSGDLVSTISVNSEVSSSTKLSDLGVSGDMDFKLSYDSDTTANPIEIKATSSDTLKTLMDKVNSQTNGSVTMSIDSTTGKITFATKSYGSTANLKIEDVSGNLDKLKITEGSKSGKDAIVEITEPGQSVATTMTQSSNKFTTNGVTYNLSNIGSTNVTVTANTDAVVDNMKKFIDEYNSVITKINTQLTEKNNKDYAPLTDAQKEDMSESQITAWETKAKSGILRNDDYLSTLLTQLRNAFSAPVYSDYNSSDPTTGKVSLNTGAYGSNAIGIDTSTDWTDGGKLVLKDETKFKDAIENNIDDLKKLFIGTSDEPSDTTKPYVGSAKYNEDGIFKRMDLILRDYVAAPGIGEDGTYTLAGSMNIFVNKQYDYSITGFGGKNTLPDQLHKKAINVSKYQTQLKDAQTRYYAKFTALETAMNTLNSQQSQLSSMLGTS